MAYISQEVIDRVDRYIQQMPEYRLVACSECQHAIWPQESRRHFAGAKHNIPSKTVADIGQVIQSWTQLIQDRIELEIPASVHQAIPQLEVFRDGILCIVAPERCHYICRSPEKIRKHLQQRHSISKYPNRGRPSQSQPTRQEAAEPQWKAVTCQRFFVQGTGSQYFEVRQPPPTACSPIASSNPLQRVVPAWEQAEKALDQRRQAIEWKDGRVIDEGDIREVNPWLERAGWHIYLAGIEREKLLESVEEPEEENEPILARVWRAMDEMMRYCQQTVIHRVGVSVRMEAIRTEKHQTRYQPLQAYMDGQSIQQYSRPWKQMVMFIGRTQGPCEWTVPKYKLRGRQRTAWRCLMRLAAASSPELTASSPESNPAEDSPESSGEQAQSQEEQSRLEALPKVCLDFCIALLDEQMTQKEY